MPGTDDEAGVDKPKRRERRGVWWIASAGAVGLVVGGIGRGFLPPFVLDEPFWRSFWSGPPAAGLFAVCAAVVAFFPAYRSTRVARESAARDQWWKRAEWALTMAGSDKQVDREVALDAFLALLSDATQTEAAMIKRTLTNLQQGGAGAEAVDTASSTADNEWKRWWPWRS
ncbi:hypothetical protein [Curtobacterium sp. MCPF17_047]|uniref:hypothetical protein n=1 Tax=Curtobacterium sp. MCPF17_047 TaxID=2175654 RepID=UPI0011B5E864|nr:hypothetical protein [Curtobacterium sp. MCPF17_047]